VSTRDRVIEKFIDRLKEEEESNKIVEE